ncbi:TIGR00159 family protein, partial [Treponema pallidum]
MVLWYAAYVRPLLDVALLSFLLYKTYEILVKTQAVQLVKGAFSILVLYALVFVLKLETLLWILNATAPGVAISITIVFQPELRKIFLKIGEKNWLRQRECAHHTHIDAVLTAADVLSKRK